VRAYMSGSGAYTGYTGSGDDMACIRVGLTVAGNERTIRISSDH
jgi:hypothetical protein